MRIRPATSEDLSPLSHASLAAFIDDKLYEWMHPRSHQYPEDLRQFFLRRYRMRYWSPGITFHVAETDEQDAWYTGKPEVMGHAIWHREGKSPQARKWHEDTLRMRIERALLSATETYLTFTRADNSLDYERRKEWFSKTGEDFAEIDELWKLISLGIHPKYQRKGVGGMFLDWGIEQANTEQVPIGLGASQMGQGLYLKKGFRLYKTVDIEGFFVQPVLLYEPEGIKGRWVKKEEPWRVIEEKIQKSERDEVVDAAPA